MSKFCTLPFFQYSSFPKFHFNFSWLVLQSTVYAQNYQRARPLFKPDKRPKPDTKALPACQEPDVVSCQKVKIKNGALKVIPKSHKHGFIRDDENWKKNIIPKNLISDKLASKFGNFIDVPTELGDTLIFSTFSIHKSGINDSNNIRFSLNFRFNDIESQDYADRNFYLNEKTQQKTFDVDFNPIVNFN